MRDTLAWSTLAVVIAGSAIAYNHFQPNEGQVRFQDDTLTVNADAVMKWGEASPYAVVGWGVPVEFVSHDEADITFVIGKTKCTEVEGFGRACAEGTAKVTMGARRWIDHCVITLREDSTSTALERDVTVAHEFGHCLSQKHNDTEDSIMGTVLPSENYEPEHFSYVITGRDRWRVAQLYG